MPRSTCSKALEQGPTRLRKKPGFLFVLKKYKFYCLLLLPGLLYFITFRYVPILASFVAFKDVQPYDTLETMLSAPWVGFKHFGLFLNSYYFWNILGNTFYLAFLRMVFEFGLPIVFALMINELTWVRYKKVVQTISYMPYFISTVVLASLVFSLLSLDTGIVPAIVRSLGYKPLYYVGDVNTFRAVLITAIVWKNLGWNTIIYLAALSGVDPQLYEACIMDGGTKWHQLVYMTLPSISYAIVIMFILRVTVILNQGYEETLLLYSAPVYRVADIIDTYVFRIGLEQLRYSYAAAVGLFKGLLSLTLVFAASLLARKLGQKTLFS